MFKEESKAFRARRCAGESRVVGGGAGRDPAGLALDPAFTVRRFRAGATSDNSTYLVQRERVYQGMRKTRVPEG
jgi:hypothetical protein